MHNRKVLHQQCNIGTDGHVPKDVESSSSPVAVSAVCWHQGNVGMPSAVAVLAPDML